MDYLLKKIKSFFYYTVIVQLNAVRADPGGSNTTWAEWRLRDWIQTGTGPAASMTQAACRSQTTAATEGGVWSGVRKGGLRQAAGLQYPNHHSVFVEL